eukprot:PhF_6_TR906/c0_g1_i2/m.1479
MLRLLLLSAAVALVVTAHQHNHRHPSIKTSKGPYTAYLFSSYQTASGCGDGWNCNTSSQGSSMSGRTVVNVVNSTTYCNPADEFNPNQLAFTTTTVVDLTKTVSLASTFKVKVSCKVYSEDYVGQGNGPRFAVGYSEGTKNVMDGNYWPSGHNTSCTDSTDYNCNNIDWIYTPFGWPPMFINCPMNPYTWSECSEYVQVFQPDMGYDRPYMLLGVYPDFMEPPYGAYRCDGGHDGSAYNLTCEISTEEYEETATATRSPVTRLWKCGNDMNNNFETPSCWEPEGIPDAFTIIDLPEHGNITIAVGFPEGRRYADMATVFGLNIPATTTVYLSNAIQLAGDVNVKGTLNLASGYMIVNNMDVAHDPQLLRQGFQDCTVPLGGFCPRVCGTGSHNHTLIVAKGGHVIIGGQVDEKGNGHQYSSMFMDMIVQAGGNVTLLPGSFIWGHVVNYGNIVMTASIWTAYPAGFYLHGQIINKGYMYIYGNLWFDTYDNNPTVPIIINDPSGNMVLAGGYLASGGGTIYGQPVLYNRGKLDLNDIIIWWTINNTGIMNIKLSESNPLVSPNGKMSQKDAGGINNIGGAIYIQGPGVFHLGTQIVLTRKALLHLDNVVVFTESPFIVSDKSNVRLVNNAQINFHGSAGIYCWESCFKYCGSNCNDPSCPCRADGGCNKGVDGIESFGLPHTPAGKLHGYHVFEMTADDAFAPRQKWVDNFHNLIGGANTKTLNTNHVSFSNGARITGDGSG